MNMGDNLSLALHGISSSPLPCKLTMLIAATAENVAPPHCSDECEMNSQKPARGIGGIAKI
jgi:hypothetical protein